MATIITGTVVATSAPAAAAAPDLQLPFPCGQKWRLDTWGHAPALDMVKEPDQHGTDGATLVAAAAGTVSESRWLDSSGWSLQINHGGRYFTTYIHLKSKGLAAGTKVKRGTVIGKVGASGSMSNNHPHLHFELGYDSNGDGRASWGDNGEKVRPTFNGVTYGQANSRTWRNVESHNCGGSDEPDPPSLFGADFNGDGIGDIFATGTGSLTIWNGKGGNNFTPPDVVGANWNTYSRPIGGDFNGDGKGDLAAVKDGTLHIWNGKGGNKFTSAEEVGSGWSYLARTLVSLGDVNKDGRTDIGAVDPDGVLYIWNGKGKNNFTSRDRVGSGWTGYGRPVGGDFNADKIGDIAAVDTDGVLHIWNGKGGNNFTPAVRVGSGWNRALASTLMSLGDVNGDGHTDLAAVQNGTLSIWNGKGNNKFGSAEPTGPGWTPHFPAEFGADFDSDGVGDIFATGTGSLHVWNGKGSNNFTPADSVGAGWTDVSRPVAADFNRDGIGDLAAVRDGTLHIWNGKGDNKFTPAEAVGPGWEDLAATLVSLGDVNSDGHPDLAAIDTEGVLHIWNGQGNNNFHPPVRIGSGWTGFSRPIGGDFNRDGIGDIAAVKDGTLSIWNGRGHNKFTPAEAVGPGWTDLAHALMSLGDVNGDGQTDIAAIDPEGYLHVYNGQGGNNFDPPVRIGPNWNEHFPR